MNTTSLCNSNSGPGSPFSPQRRSPEYSSATSSAYSGSGEQEVRLASNNPKKRAGRKKFTETRHPVYRGVRRKSSGRWVCELREPTKQMRIWLGTFPTLEMAARAYDAAAIALRGKNACVNFADSFTRLRIPDSTDPKIIQKAAAEAAEAFRPSATEVHALPVSSGEDRNSGISNVSNYEQTEESAANNADSTNNNGTEECGTSSVNYSNLSNMNMNSMMEEYGSFGSFGSGQQENRYYMDDESIFDMPGLLADMASGMMLPPLGYAVTDEIQFDDNIDLWSY